MTATAQQRALATDPSTTAETLFELAAAEPELWPAIAVHPNVYPGLLDWMHEYGLPRASAGVEDVPESLGRGAGEPAATAERPLVTSSDEPRAEPTVEPIIASLVSSAAPRTPTTRQWRRPSRRVLALSIGGLMAAVLAVVLVMTLVVAPAQRAAEEEATAQQKYDAAVELFHTAVKECNARNVGFDGVLRVAKSALETDPATMAEPQLIEDLAATIEEREGTPHCESPQMASTAAEIAAQRRMVNDSADALRVATAALTRAISSVTESVSAKSAAEAAAAAEAQRQADAAAAAARTWTMTSPEGFTYTLRIDVGAPTLTQSWRGAPPGYSECGSGVNQQSCIDYTIAEVCPGFDPATMIAVPVTVTTTATTAGFPTRMSANISIGTSGKYRGPNAAPQGAINTATAYSDGPSCQTLTNIDRSIGVSWPDEVAAGETRTFEFAIVLAQWKTPNAPNGDPALLDWIAVWPSTTTAIDSSVTYSPSGPSGVVTLNNQPR